jgi:hypothetical protein
MVSLWVILIVRVFHIKHALMVFSKFMDHTIAIMCKKAFIFMISTQVIMILLEIIMIFLNNNANFID